MAYNECIYNCGAQGQGRARIYQVFSGRVGSEARSYFHGSGIRRVKHRRLPPPPPTTYALSDGSSSSDQPGFGTRKTVLHQMMLDCN